MSIKQGDRYIAGGGAGSVETDNISISTNASNKIQSIGNINKNPATGALPVKYDWIGTLAEFNQQDIVNTHPEWVCYVTDDVAGGESVYTKEEVDEGFLATNKITNCITEIPQDIKLELNNGTLTLKAGSKVYVPNGAGVFDTVTVSNDITVSPNNGEKLFFLHPDGTHIYHGNTPSQMYSGSSQPSISYGFWYDTTNNVIKFTSNGSTWISGFSLPIAKGSNTSIDQVFNGFGYIGSTVFALPGVKGLIPNGRNADGTLKNTEFTINNVLTEQLHDTVDVACYLHYNGQNTLELFTWTGFLNQYVYKLPSNPLKYGRYYNITDNLWYFYDGSNWNKGNSEQCCYLGKGFISSNKYNGIELRTPFHALDYNDLNNIPHIVETYVNGTSWYRVYSDGWCEQGGANNSGDINGWQTVSFIKPYSNTDYYISVVEVNSTYRSFNIDGTHSDYFRYEAISVVGNKIRWYACGYIS